MGVAASAAVRMGVSLAIAERERRARRARLKRERQFALLPDERPLEGIRRMALAQLDLSIELLSAENGSLPMGEAIHETRKALKRLRTLVRLLADELGTAAADREQLVLREAGRRIAGARDADVMVTTLEQLQSQKPRLARRRGVRRLHALLLSERDHATARLTADGRLRADVIADLRGVRRRITAFQPPPAAGLEGLEGPFKRLYRSGRRRKRRAASARSGRAVAMHRWRKRVKDLRYAAEAISRSDPGKGASATIVEATVAIVPTRKRAGTRRRKSAITRLARRADQLGEALGEEHDLFLLGERVREESCGRGTRRRLLRAISHRRKRLRRRALRDGERIYGRKPKRMLAIVRSSYQRESAR